MNDSDPPTRDGRSYYPGCLPALVLLLLVPAGAGLGFLGWVAMTDSKDASDHWWGTLALAGAAGMVLGGLLAVVFVGTRNPALRNVVAVCLGAGLIADIWAAEAGVKLVFAAEARGGDWGALAVATAKIFCVAVPISSAIITGIALACVWHLPRDRGTLVRSPANPE